MVQMLTRLKPLGRPKQPRPTPKLNNTTIRDFGGGLNVVDSEQNLTSKFSPVFDNMVTYTDRRVGPRYGYEMWLKLKQGVETSGTKTGTIEALLDSYVVTMHWTAHGFTAGNHVTLSGFTDVVNGVTGITAIAMNRMHSIRRIVDANTFEIVITDKSKATGISANITWTWKYDTHALGGEPVECRYFANYVILWTSIGEILRIDRFQTAQRIWDQNIAFGVNPALPGWTHTELVAQDIFGKELICSNGYNKPLTIDFTRIEAGEHLVMYAFDPGNAGSNDLIPSFDACKSAFRFFTIHDTDANEYPAHITEVRISARDTYVVYNGAPNAADSTDIDMSKIAASPEQTVRGFATIKDAILVISPNTTSLLKYGAFTEGLVHDPVAIDTMNGFGSNAPRTIVEIGSDVFMVDFNGVPSAKLSTLSNAIVPERVSNYIETMMSRHIGRLRKDTMRLKAFGFYDGKNRTVHFYLPKFDEHDIRDTTDDPFFFDTDMARDELTKSTLILRLDSHLLEQGDLVDISGAEGFATILPEHINGRRTVVGVLNDNYILVSIGRTLPLEPIVRSNGGGAGTKIKPVSDGMIGYIFHYVPQLKLNAWSRFKTTARQDFPAETLIFNCGCGTLEGRSYLFTPDGFMMRYGSPDNPAYGDWKGMYDSITSTVAHPWVNGTVYAKGHRVYDGHDELVYRCIADTVAAGPTFQEAREADPDAWEEYRGEPINFAWELPWSDFGQRQHTKALRFCHIDANGQAPFKVELFTDNIYRNASTGQLQCARALTFVPNEAGAYGAGPQVYGAGRRTREQKLWQMPVKCKLLKVRTTGATTQPLSISALSFMYQKGTVVRG
jgi:hypothetical protein